MVLVHPFWRCLELIFGAKYVLAISLWVWLWFAEMCHELGLRDDPAKAVRGTLDVSSGTQDIVTRSVRQVQKFYLIKLSSFLPGHHAPAASRLSFPGLTAREA